MKYLFFVCLLFPTTVFAADVSFLDDVYNTIVGIPTFIERSFAYFIEWFVYAKFYFFMESVDFAYGVAQELAGNLGLFQLIDSALGQLSIEQRAIFETFGFREGFSLIVNALMTRFVLNFMGI